MLGVKNVNNSQRTKTPNETMKQLTPQILGMYLGCRIMVTRGRWKVTGTLGGVDSNGSVMLRDSTTNFTPDEDWIENDRGFDILSDGVKPVLRRLEDMTEGEAYEYGIVAKVWHDGTAESYMRKKSFASREHAVVGKYRVAGLMFLLSKSFDLFNLIDSGLAIDSKTIVGGLTQGDSNTKETNTLG